MHVLVFLSALCGFCLSFPSVRLIEQQRRHTRDVDNATEHPSVFQTLYEINQGGASFNPQYIITHLDIAVGVKRAASSCRMGICLWPMSDDGNVYVPYTTPSTFQFMERVKVRTALNDLEEFTCIRFIPLTREKDYIRFESMNGCWSSLGCMGGAQIVSLQNPGCMWTGVITHEVMHALGLHHEHIRRDRDRYVSVQWDNILPGSRGYFEQADTFNLELTRYDYGSIMHYGRTAFSIDGILPTLISVSKDDVSFGQEAFLSELDIEKINILYNCTGQQMNKLKAVPTTAKTTTRTTTPTTTHTTITTRTTASTTPRTTKMTRATTKTTTITQATRTSPTTTKRSRTTTTTTISPRVVNNGQQKNKLMEAPSTAKTTTRTTTSTTPGTTRTTTTTGTTKSTTPRTTTTTRATSKTTTTTQATSTSRTTTKRSPTTTTTTTISPPMVNNGCSGNFTATPGVITTPNYPNNYPSKAHCVWNITNTSPFVVTFTDFDIEEAANCVSDSVTIYKGPTVDKKYFTATYCGNKLPSQIYSFPGTVLIVLTTDGTVQYKGFRLVYEKA